MQRVPAGDAFFGFSVPHGRLKFRFHIFLFYYRRTLGLSGAEHSTDPSFLPQRRGWVAASLRAVRLKPLVYARCKGLGVSLHIWQVKIRTNVANLFLRFPVNCVGLTLMPFTFNQEDISVHDRGPGFKINPEGFHNVFADIYNSILSSFAFSDQNPASTEIYIRKR